jgi:hypothetical protein
MLSPLVIMLVTAVLTVAFGYPLKHRKVKPNWFYGFRTPATLKDPVLWYEVNEKTGKDLMTLGGVLFVLAASLGAMKVKDVALAGACMAWIALGSTLMVGRGLLFIQQETRKTRKADQS